MRILITGITGRIGANLAAILHKNGHQIRGLVWPKDPRVEKLASLGLELHEGSLTQKEDVQAAAQGIDAIYHLGAAFQGGGPFTETDYFEINLRGTFHVLEAARSQPTPPQIVFAGTDAVYEKYVPGGLDEPIREDAPSRPQGWYALSKSLAEDLCIGYWRTYKLPVTVLRFSMVVGAGEILDFSQFYLSKLKSQPGLENVWQGEERLVILKDTKGRPFKKHIADVRDIVHGCACALGKTDAAGEIIQLGAPSAFTWDEAIPHLSQRLNIPYIEAVSQGQVTHYEFDLSKARRLLGFNPQYDICRMIDDALAFRQGKNTDILPTT
ncbi:MAG: NAD(P)-dependent oxidoreductase [bacterium]|nr:NAD(P)-dependent oxidoreductase [bacterium]